MSRSLRTISLMVAAVLVTLPIAGAVCGMLCGPAAAHASAGSHHGSVGIHQGHGPSSADHPTRSSTGTEIHGVSPNDCGSHDGLLLHASAVGTRRADGNVGSCPLAIATTRAADRHHPSLSQEPEYAPPPGTAPPTTAPLVLRI